MRIIESMPETYRYTLAIVADDKKGHYVVIQTVRMDVPEVPGTMERDLRCLRRYGMPAVILQETSSVQVEQEEV